MPAEVFDVLACTSFFMPLVFLILIYSHLPDTETHMNELFRKYGTRHTVKVIQTFGGLLPFGGRGSPAYIFMVELPYEGKWFSYRIGTDSSYARKYYGKDSFDVLILPDYFDYEADKIHSTELIEKYSSDEVKFKICHEYTYPAMIFPERLERYEAKLRKKEKRKNKKNKTTV